MRAIVVLSIVLLSASVSGQTTGDVVGCITDGFGQPLPGATVSAAAQGGRLTVVADRSGCYEFRKLAPHSYRMTAQLSGFDNVTRDKIKVEPGQPRRLDFMMVGSVISLCDCETPGTTLQQMSDRVDAVVYVRITDHNHELPTVERHFTQTADVIEVLKYPAPAVEPPFDPATKALQQLLRREPSAGSVRAAMTFVQEQTSGAGPAYAPGEEFVLFLHWWPVERTFVARTFHARDRSDRDTVFVIQNRRVTRAPRSLTRYVDAPVDTLLAELRRVSHRK